MKLVNTKPTVLSPIYKDVISKDYDMLQIMYDAIIPQIMQPLVPSQPAQIANGNEQNFIEKLYNVITTDRVNIQAEDEMKNLMRQALVYFPKNTNALTDNLFVLQAAQSETPPLPEPTNKIVYTPSIDVIPAARKFLAGQCNFEELFASLAFYAKPTTFGVYFANEIAFNNFKQWLSNQINTLSMVMPPEDMKLVTDFQSLSLNQLTESLILRNDMSQNNHPYSFARTLIALIMNYTSTVSSAEFGLMPFSVCELFCPKTIVFINIEKHAKASAKEIKNEWDLINNSIQNKSTMISNKSLNKLTTAQRNLQKIANASNLYQTGGLQDPLQRAANIRFSKKRPSQVDMVRIIRKVLHKMAFVNTSMNTFKQTSMTYRKPNRRDPDDFNKQGKSTSTRYLPDIHLYIDTSGSISEENYQEAVQSMILMAKKLNINMYFNSFSHKMSQTTKLNLQGKSTAGIYKEFQKVSKVTGGTDYEQIWQFINHSKKRKGELSIIITDFEWTAGRQQIEHPKNLFYIPCSNTNWNNIVYYAEHFAKSMMHIDPAIRAHILF